MKHSGWFVAAGVVLAAVAAAVVWREWPLAVEVASVTRGPAIEAVYATGAVEPSVMLPVAPRSGGRLAALLVDEGAAVKKGQVLARMESPDLVHTVDEMRARERLAQTQYERTQELVAQKFMSPAELDRTRTELDAAQAALKRAQAQLDVCIQPPPREVGTTGTTALPAAARSQPVGTGRSVAACSKLGGAVLSIHAMTAPCK